MPSEEDRPYVDLPRRIQAALAGVGCDPGTVDGVWGRKSDAALDRFGKHAGVALPAIKLSEETLALLEERTGQVCPATCARGEVRRGEICVAAKRKTRRTRKSRRARSRLFRFKAKKPKGTQRANGGVCAIDSQCGREN